MLDQLFDLAINDGIWALLFCFLLVFELRDSRTREAKYQATISTLSEDLTYMNTMSKTIDQIQDDMRYVLDKGKQGKPRLAKEFI